MDEVIADIVEALRSKEALDDKELSRILHEHNRRAVKRAREQSLPVETRPYSKKRLLPYVLRMRAERPDVWDALRIDETVEKRLFATLQMKPRRTASGVATITVITKPWPCSNACIYCPNDVRMPKSYMHNEPACQRAERNFFDPYLQVQSRLKVLVEMGHPCEKIELIVLGGTWTDYPQSYRVWFVHELFRALNDGFDARECERVRRLCEQSGMISDPLQLEHRAKALQSSVDRAELSYNDAIARADWPEGRICEPCGFDALEAQHRRNENALHRVVGLVVETRPDAIDAANLTEIRRLGCTKVQIGIQGLDESVLRENGRHLSVEQMAHAFDMLRLFGFKIHSHFMLNLYGSSPQEDIDGYRRFAQGREFQPDEVKLYPCALIGATKLAELFAAGAWKPYPEEVLVDVLVQNLKDTRPFTRVSRMIRDFTAGDIVAGNKKTNLRQMVEKRIAEEGFPVQEIRYREINRKAVDYSALALQDVVYETNATEEHFLQWVGTKDEIAGFLRLSLPSQDAVVGLGGVLPVGVGEAMIREVHVYGQAARIDDETNGAQHRGLGKALVARACEIAKRRGYAKVNVISAIGTRGYYRNLGFRDAGLYQQKTL